MSGGHTKHYGYAKAGKTIIRSDGRRVADLHVVLAEKAFGKELPLGVVVHHADGNAENNSTDNLVICPDEAYHRLLHKRLKAYFAVGNPDWVQCSICQQFSDPKDPDVWQAVGRVRHRSCAKAKAAKYYQDKKDA